MRTILCLLVALVAVVPLTRADEAPWAEKLFDGKTSRDFGNVAHGAQMAHKFTFKNIYAVPLDVTISKVGCGCVTATSSTQKIEPHGTGTIEVNMNGRQFTGPRTVRVSVTFTNPQFFSTADLKVTANSRPDVVFNPGEVDFGVVPQGQGARKAIDVEYAGALKWEVTEVNANGLPLEIDAPKVKYQRAGQVGYTISVALKPDAPAGPVKGEIFLKTNDPSSPLMPVLVEANVQAALTVSPPNVRLNARAGESKTASVVLRGNKPFRVQSADGLGEGVSLTTALPTAAADTHRLTFKVQRDGEGDFRRKVQINTDLQKAPVTVTIEGSVGK